MFGAIAHLLFRFTIPSVMHTVMTRTNREMTVEFIADNLHEESLVTFIIQRIRHEFPMISSADTREKMKAFTARLLQDGTWDADESHALTKLFACDINLCREKGFRTRVELDDRDCDRLINRVYRGMVNDWN